MKASFQVQRPEAEFGCRGVPITAPSFPRRPLPGPHTLTSISESAGPGPAPAAEGAAGAALPSGPPLLLLPLPLLAAEAAGLEGALSGGGGGGGSAADDMMFRLRHPQPLGARRRRGEEA